MAGPYLWFKEELRPAVKRALAATVGWPWSIWAPRNWPVAGRGDLPYWQDFRVRTE